MFIVPAVVLDTLVACFLTIGLYKNSKLFISKMPLVNLIIRDGVLYFCVVFASNVAWILTAVLADNDVSTFVERFSGQLNLHKTLYLRFIRTY